MQIPRYPSERCLLITDAGLGSLVLSAMASEQPPADDQQRSMLYPAWWTSQSDLDLRIPALDRAIQSQADLLSLSVIKDHAGYPEEDFEGGQASLGIHQTRMLLDAATLAIQMGIKRVLWPIQANVDYQHESESTHNLHQIAAAIDRSLLCARLATLDAQDHGGVEVTIETPLVDLTNSQIADLAADLNVPINACWWTDSSLPGAEIEYKQWAQESQTALMLQS